MRNPTRAHGPVVFGLILAVAVSLPWLAAGCDRTVEPDPPPVPGDGGAITAAVVRDLSVRLAWARAEDPTWPASQLRYVVVSSGSNDIGTLEEADGNGRLETQWQYDIEGALVTGLTPSTTYYFTVIVENVSGERAIYQVVEVTTLALIDEPPRVGGAGVLTLSNITSDGVTLAWTAADDDYTAPASLEYKVVSSPLDNIDSFVDAEINGTVVRDWTTNLTQFNVTGLNPDTRYFFNVLVRDEVANLSAYSSVSATTLEGDTTPPVPGNSGALTVTTVGSTNMTVQWDLATDDVTAAAALEYRVVWSTSDNIGTLPLAEANGTLLQDWTAALTSADATGLTPSTPYYFNVIVRDAADNRATYARVTDTTLP